MEGENERRKWGERGLDVEAGVVVEEGEELGVDEEVVDGDEVGEFYADAEEAVG